MVMNIHVTTQYRENYGTAEAPYWKFKGGSVTVITGFNHPMTSGIRAAAEQAIESVRSQIEYANDMAEESIVDWEFAPVDALTSWERDQMEYDGRITSPSTRIVLP